eukprot:CAMPEP_0172377870 /NCGR_PEP_ID=MMETSP1060-20121228/69132_1 /TAXON_ID=37318 /ORGANISM="Pseudo-nitzschia pungens, Strain cf. cingulata" /LENGTH=142 /DNA_ID=CAMNT_0013105581 /DNA_START=674 /DNA_END=1102 /DNA_ORIENTATION=+
MIFRKTLFTLLVASAAASNFVEPPEDVRVLANSDYLCPPEGVNSGDSCDIFDGGWGECREKDSVIACETGDRTCRCDVGIPFECSCYGVFASRYLFNETDAETDDFVEEEEEPAESMSSAAATTSVLAASGALAASALVLAL